MMKTTAWWNSTWMHPKTKQVMSGMCLLRACHYQACYMPIRFKGKEDGRQAAGLLFIVNQLCSTANDTLA